MEEFFIVVGEKGYFVNPGKVDRWFCSDKQKNLKNHIKNQSNFPVVHLAQIHFNFVQISLEYEKIEILNHGKRSDF